MRYPKSLWSAWVEALGIMLGVGFGILITLLVFWGLTEFFYWTEIW
jgi:hypothetical protein